MTTDVTEPKDPARFGVEPFDVGYGASFAAEADSPLDIECEVVEDAGALNARDPQQWAAPSRIAFVDGTMRTDARLTRVGADGVVYTGLAGSWAVGAAIANGEGQLTVDHVKTERVAIFCGGTPATLPTQPGGWSWVADTVQPNDLSVANQRLQRRMRNAEGELNSARTGGASTVSASASLASVSGDCV